MKYFHHHLMLTTALAAGLVVAAPLVISQVCAEESATVQTNPGFKPDAGQINSGRTLAAPSSATDIRKIPTHAEAVAALMAPDDPNPVPGAEAPQQTSNAPNKTVTAQPAGGGDPTTATQGQAAIGGPLSPGASSGGGNNASATGANTAGAAQGTTTTETTGARPASTANANRPGPIGATGQTMPAKFSERNDTLDRVPIMAWPMSLSYQERQQIYQAVMADTSQPATNAEKLAPASELSTDQALNGMYALPASLGHIAAVAGLKYLKAKDKVLLVQASTRTVIEQITP